MTQTTNPKVHESEASVPPLDTGRPDGMTAQPPVTYLEHSLIPSGSAWNQLRAVNEESLRQREEILSLPSDALGINMDRVYAYREEIGMPHKSLVVLGPDDMRRARTIAGDDRTWEIAGSYFPRPDVSAVERDPELEELNGQELFESFAIHEGAHAWHVPTIGFSPSVLQRLVGGLTGRAVTSMPDRRGFMVTREDGKVTGQLLEEAYAELERGLYVVHVLHRPYGFLQPPDQDKRVENRQVEHPDDFYDKYRLVVRRDGELWSTIPIGAYGAVVLEILIQQDPGILQLLRHFRNQPETITQLAERMDAIEPGIFEKLNDISGDGGQILEQVQGIAKPILAKALGSKSYDEYGPRPLLRH